MNTHILTQDLENKTVDCIFHVPVPATSNAAGIPWRQAVVEYFSPTATLPNNTTENTQIENGEVLEVRETVRFSSQSLTDAERLTQINNAYLSRASAIQNELAIRLNFWGYKTDVGG